MTRFLDEPVLRDTAAGRARVLIVDDYPETAEVLAILVERLGYECRTASTGRHALATILEFDPQIIVLDLGLPDLSGFEVAQIARTQRGGSNRKIVAFTGWATNTSRQRALDAGFDAFLVKPATESKLRAALRDATQSAASKRVPARAANLQDGNSGFGGSSS